MWCIFQEIVICMEEKMKKNVFTMIALAVILLAAGCPASNDPTTETYTITVNPSGAVPGESVTADVSVALEGETVTLLAALDDDRQVTLSATDVDITPSIINTFGGTATFIMPAADVAVTAVFGNIPEPTYEVTVTSIGAAAGETVTANVSNAEAGATITLTAALNSGREVTLSAPGVTITPETITTTGGTASFTMPSGEVAVTAAFEYPIGITESVSAGAETLTMIYANNADSISFPVEADDSGSATLSVKFWIAETEVTNAVMAEVLEWAYDNGRFSTTVTDHNGLNATTVKYGGQELLDLDNVNCRVDYDEAGNFTAASGYEDHPVTNITWYGAVMFCNWLTEMRDGNTDNVVYTGINDTWDTNINDPDTVENVARNGFRLPSSDEWEYAARYRGSDTTNTVSGYENPYFTQGDSASGAIADQTNAGACQAVAVYSGLSPVPTDEAAVKSRGAGSANALGAYDMSGNVNEWCFTMDGSTRFIRGGGYALNAYYIQVSFKSGGLPFDGAEDIGFRLCRTAD